MNHQTSVITKPKWRMIESQDCQKTLQTEKSDVKVKLDGSRVSDEGVQSESDA